MPHNQTMHYKKVRYKHVLQLSIPNFITQLISFFEFLKLSTAKVCKVWIKSLDVITVIDLNQLYQHNFYHKWYIYAEV